jgi:cytoskeleton protein RodZ
VDDGEQAAGAADDSAADIVARPAGAEPIASPILFGGDRIVSVPLVIEFGTESWAEVTDGRGERLAYDLQPAGRRLVVRGTPPFAVVLGDASAVQITVDGQPYEITARRRSDNFVRFSVDIAGE